MRKAGQMFLKKTMALALATAMTVTVPAAVFAEQTNDNPGGAEQVTELPDEAVRDDATDGEESTEEEQSNESVISTQELQESVYSVSVQSDGLIEVPEEALIIDANGVCNGIKEEWFNDNKPQNGQLLKVIIPEKIKSIAKNAFNASNAPSSSAKLGATIGTVDFSQATSLENIGYAAFQNQTNLTGELNFSETKVKVIDGSAFDNTGLTGVVLPTVLTSLGTASNGGSVFRGCPKLQYVRVANGDTNATFELPENLTYIGGYTFKNSFANPVRLKLPANVATIGSEAFNSGKIEQMIVERESDFSGFNAKAVYGSGMAVFKNGAAYNSFANRISSSYRNNLTYQFTLSFEGTNVTAQKLNYKSIQYELDGDTGFWKLNESYTLPDPPANAGTASVGYNTRWTLDDDELTKDSVLNVTGDSATAIYTATLVPLEINYSKNGELQSNENFTVELTKAKKQSIGVKVSHPLLLTEQGTAEDYVFITYSWSDIDGNWFAGPRAAEEPDLFDKPGQYNWTSNAEIPITSVDHARTGDNGRYMVTIRLGHKKGTEPVTYSIIESRYIYVNVTQAPTYTVTYDLDGGDAAGTDYSAVTLEAGESLELAKAPTKAGYMFTGWSDSTNIYPAGDSVSIAGDTTFTAQWQEVDQWVDERKDDDKKLDIDVDVSVKVEVGANVSAEVAETYQQALGQHIHDLLNTTAKGEVPAGMTADQAQELRDLLNTGAPDIDVQVTIEADLQQTPTADDLQTLLGSSYSLEETAQQWELSVVLTAVAKNATGDELDTVNQVALRETAPITIVLTTGQDLTGKDVRVLYNHDNAVGTAPSQVLDAAEGKVAVTASKFSPYVVLSKAKPAAPADNGSSNDRLRCFQRSREGDSYLYERRGDTWQRRSRVGPGFGCGSVCFL